LGNLNRIGAFFRDKGYKGILPEKGKAIKLLELIDAFPKAGTFAKRFQDHPHARKGQGKHRSFPLRAYRAS
jgi:hypothetical protein